MNIARRSFCVSCAAIGVFSVAQLVGCNAQVGLTDKTPVKFVSKYEPIEFTFPGSWHNNTEDHPFDLQVLSESGEMNTGVFAFKRGDLEEGQTPSDILQDQIADIAGKRNNFTKMGPPETTELPDKTITTVDCAGDKGANRFCYSFSLIDFHEGTAPFAVALQVAFLEDWRRMKPELREVLLSAKHIAPTAAATTDSATVDDPAPE